MASTASRSVPASTFSKHHDKDARPKQTRTDIWTSLLRQTRVAQSRNRSNAVVNRHIIVCGGSSDDQKTFLQSVTRPPPPQPIRKNRGDSSQQQKEKGVLALSNRYAYGYGHVSLFSAQHGGAMGNAFGRESEEIARLECHCVPEPNAAYEVILRRLLSLQNKHSDDNLHLHSDDVNGEVSEASITPAVTILLSWKEPWNFLRKLRAWLQLLARASKPAGELGIQDDPVDFLKEAAISVNVVIQHVETQETLEREGWTEETFDKVCQVVRTAILPLHPHSSLAFMPSILSPQQSSAPLTELQKVIYTSLELDLSTLSPRPTSSSGTSTSAPVKKEELAPRHNVVDRMNIIIPAGWDSAGKIRLASEGFSPEDILVSWTSDLMQSMIPVPASTQQPELSQPTDGTQANTATDARRQAEEVYSADASSPVSPESDLPPSPSKSQPSAIRAYETQIVDPNAHKAPKPPTITVFTRPEQEFLREMKAELDNYVAQDRARNAQDSSPSASTGGRIIGLPSGESTGALDGLGDVSFNVGGVSYNTVSTEAAIERLKRPHLTLGQDSPGASKMGQNVSSPSAVGSRTTTPRPPRRFDLSDRERTPGALTPSSSLKSDIPAEDLEKYFASLAKKAGGTDSRGGTPSRQ